MQSPRSSRCWCGTRTVFRFIACSLSLPDARWPTIRANVGSRRARNSTTILPRSAIVESMWMTFGKSTFASEQARAVLVLRAHVDRVQENVFSFFIQTRSRRHRADSRSRIIVGSSRDHQRHTKVVLFWLLLRKLLVVALLLLLLLLWVCSSSSCSPRASFPKQSRKTKTFLRCVNLKKRKKTKP